MALKFRKVNSLRNKRPRRKTMKKSNIVRIVKKTIQRSQETKFVSAQYTFSAFNSTITSPADIIAIMPQIFQGAGQDQRIGNSIKPVAIIVRGYVTYYPASSTGNLDARMLGARLFCFQDKAVRSQANSDVNYNLLNLGGVSTNYTGTAMNWITPHNNDQFTFFADKKMRILKPYGYTNNVSPSTTTSITGMDNSMFHPFTIKIPASKMPSKLSFDQTDSTAYPTNFNPKISLGYSDLLNAAADVATTQIALSFCITLYFKDS